MTSAAEFLRGLCCGLASIPDVNADDINRLDQLADDIDAVIPARGGQVAHGYHDALKRIRGEA